MYSNGGLRRIGSANVDPLATLLAKLSEQSWHQDEDDSLSEGVQSINHVYDSELRHDQPLNQPALEVCRTLLSERY